MLNYNNQAYAYDAELPKPRKFGLRRDFEKMGES